MNSFSVRDQNNNKNKIKKSFGKILKLTVITADIAGMYVVQTKLYQISLISDFKKLGRFHIIQSYVKAS